MREVNLEHMNFEHRDFVTINSERINKFLNLDGGKVPSRVKGVNFDTIPHLLLKRFVILGNLVSKEENPLMIF